MPLPALALGLAVQLAEPVEVVRAPAAAAEGALVVAEQGAHVATAVSAEVAAEVATEVAAEVAAAVEAALLAAGLTLSVDETATATAASDASLPGVAVIVHGDGAPAQTAFIAERLAGVYRIVDAAEAKLFIEVTSTADGVVVEVNDALGTLSRQEISTREEERDLLVWLVVRSALERATTDGKEPPPPAVARNAVAPPPVTVAPALTPAPTPAPLAPIWLAPAVSLVGVVSTGEDLALELGPRAAVSVTLLDSVVAAVEGGYRRQTAGPVTLHALPISATAALRVPLGDVVTLAAGARLDVAPKWVGERTATSVEAGVGPMVALALPLGTLPVKLVVEGAATGKLHRQGFVLDGALYQESPWRAAVGVGCEWRWD